MRGGTGKRHYAFGHVSRAHSHERLAGITVEAWDGDRFVARTTTVGDGTFRFNFGDHFLRAQFGDRPFALTIKVAYGGKALHEGKAWKASDGEVAFEVDHEGPAARPLLLSASREWDPSQRLKVKAAHHPLPKGTLGTISHPVEVEGPEEFAETIVRIPYSPALARGIETRGARVFRWDDAAKTLRPVWNSGVNPPLGFAWAKIRRPGVYVVLGLPSDKLLADALATMAYQRRINDLDTREERARITRAALAPLVEPPIEAVEQLRQVVLKLETNTSIAPPKKDLKLGRAGSVRDITLPEDMSPNALRERLRALETPPGGLPEENLFYPPEVPGGDLAATGGAAAAFKDEQLDIIEKLDMWKYFDLHAWWPWFFSHDWWMYQANERHSGHAAGWSDIRSTNVHWMLTLPPTAVAASVYTKPAIVDGKIYVGTVEGSRGGTLYKIDLATGAIDGQYETPMLPATYGIRGIGGSPAIVGGLAFFTSIHGRVYCIDTSTMSNASPPPPALWITDLKNQDLAHNQPASNPSADSWSGPLVVNGNVYVGCGEGETADACGMVYCLDAMSGHVKWLFCANQFTNGVDNQPNVVPSSLVYPAPLPAGFTQHADPPVRGASVWSSLAFCSALNRVYVGTGNPSPDSPAPNAKYSSGCISLDATTGQFKGMWSPQPSESYWPGDNDIDVPGGPIVYAEGGQWRVAIGSKSGACVILDADTMAVIARRQILPRRNGDGTPANLGTGLPSVVPTPPPSGSENHYGVYGTPARRGSRLFVSMGSDDGIPAVADGLGDAHKTPFLRAMDDSNLSDVWPTTTDASGVTRYTNPHPPMYTSGATGLGSAAVVNDVVFACTGNPAAIYAFDTSSGTPLWQDTSPPSDFCLGAAIYGNYVVIGTGSQVRRYVLHVIRWPWFVLSVPWPPFIFSGHGPRSLSIPASVVAGGPVFGGGPVAQIGAQVRG